MFAGGRRSSSAKPKLPLLSPNAATLSGNSAPQIPGPEIGLMRTTSALSLTAPDFRHAISASARRGSAVADRHRGLDLFRAEFRAERFASLEHYCGQRHEPFGEMPMAFIRPFVSKLTVVTAYLALAFVGAIVLGVI